MNDRFKVWRDGGKTLFFALIAEMDLVVKNLINTLFISRFLGSEGAAAYEIVMPCVMIASAFVAMGYNGVQAICAKDYGANDFEAFERHKNAGYTWIILVMAVLTLLFTVFQTPMLDLLGANEGSEAPAHLSRECYSLFLLNFVPQGLFSIANCLLFFEERQKLLITNLILYGTMLSGCVLVTAANPSMAGYMTINIVGVAAADLYIILSIFVPRRKTSRAAFTAIRLRPADIRDALTLTPSIRAVRIVSMGMVFCSAISLMTSYYMLIDHVGLSVGITFLKDGLLYSLLPVIGSMLFGQTGLWAAFAAAPLLALALSLLYIFLRFGKARFPYLLEGTKRPILVLDDTLTRESCVRLSERVNKALRDRGFGDRSATQAALFTEEIGLTLIEKNKAVRKPLLVEISLLFEKDSVLLIERDSGVIFDVTDPELKIDGLSSFVINGLLNAQKEKAYLTTTGYNRNMIRFPKP